MFVDVVDVEPEVGWHERVPTSSDFVALGAYNIQCYSSVVLK